MDKFITIQGQRIEVSDDVYTAYYQDSRREKYRDVDVKRGRFITDAEDVRYVESKEISFERLSESGFEFTDNQSAEDRFIQKEQMNCLKNALSILTAEERLLIELLYVRRRTTREIGVILGISHTAVRKRHEAVLKKIRIYFEKQVSKHPSFLERE